MINPCISLRFFMICVSHNWHPEWYLVTIDLTSLSEQTEMKVTNSLQQPSSYSLAPPRLLSCWRLATQQFASPPSFCSLIFQAAFPHKLVQYPKDISIWHIHVLSIFDTHLWFSLYYINPKIQMLWSRNDLPTAYIKLTKTITWPPQHLLADTMVQSSRFVGSVSAMEAWPIWCEENAWNNSLSMVKKSTAIFHEKCEKIFQHAFWHNIKDSRECCLQKKRNDRLIDHVPKLGQHTSKPFHLDFRFLSGATEKSGKFEAHPQF